MRAQVLQDAGNMCTLPWWLRINRWAGGIVRMMLLCGFEASVVLCTYLR